MMHRRARPRQGVPRRRAGVVLVELALVVPIFVALVVGCLEMGALFGDMMLLGNGSREGVRAAAVGATTSEIATTVRRFAAALHADDLQIVSSYRTGAPGTGSWVTLEDRDGQNVAPANSEVRVALSYEHHMLTGSLFARLTHTSGASTVELSASRTMRRE